MGKWIECDICNAKIRIRSQFCFTEWDTHCSGVEHCRIAKCETLKKSQNRYFFKIWTATKTNSTVDVSE